MAPPPVTRSKKLKALVEQNESLNQQVTSLQLENEALKSVSREVHRMEKVSDSFFFRITWCWSRETLTWNSKSLSSRRRWWKPRFVQAAWNRSLEHPPNRQASAIRLHAEDRFRHWSTRDLPRKAALVSWSEKSGTWGSEHCDVICKFVWKSSKGVKSFLFFFKNRSKHASTMVTPSKTRFMRKSTTSSRHAHCRITTRWMLK